MFYKSTRNSEVKVSSAQAIAQGISEDGGLFVPSEIPAITLDDIKALGEKSYNFKVYFINPRGDYATWRATRQSSGYDLKTFEVRARPVEPIANLRPGMSVIVNRN